MDYRILGSIIVQGTLLRITPTPSKPPAAAAALPPALAASAPFAANPKASIVSLSAAKKPAIVVPKAAPDASAQKAMEILVQQAFEAAKKQASDQTAAIEALLRKQAEDIAARNRAETRRRRRTV